jgi:hypothetical protein
MRTFILLTSVAMLAGCQHAQKCTQSIHSMSPLTSCKVRDAGNCREQTTRQRPCDLSNACREVQSKCRNICQTPLNFSCKKPTIGWKEVRVPVLKLSDRLANCVSDRRCNNRPSCEPGTACRQPARSRPEGRCTTPTSGCCQESLTRATQATPFLTLPHPRQAEAAVPQPQSWQLHAVAPQTTLPIAGSTTTNLTQRTQALEVEVNQIHSILQQRQATNLPTSGYINRQPAQPKEVIVLPPPAWRTMDGVPPIPNSDIEQTGACRSPTGTYQTAGTPQMWQHSPQNVQRSMYR